MERNAFISVFSSLENSCAHKSSRHSGEQHLDGFYKSKIAILISSFGKPIKDNYGHLYGYLICTLTQLALLIKCDIDAKT